MNQVVQFVKNFWYSLPHYVQAILVVFASAFATSLGHAYADPLHACWQWPCIKEGLAASVGAGVIAARAFYMRPGPGRTAGPTLEGTASNPK